jgi:hypothetical protein
MFEQLFHEALLLTREASIVSPPTIEEHPTAAVCSKISPVQVRLKQSLLKRIPALVREAASQGRTSVDLLAFRGNDKFEDHEFSYLFLLKGPRDHEQHRDLRKYGYVPLLNTLVNDVMPFGLVFRWIPGANLNKLILEWGPPQLI